MGYIHEELPESVSKTFLKTGDHVIMYEIVGGDLQLVLNVHCQSHYRDAYLRK